MINVKLSARIAGILYLIITVAAVIAHFKVPGALFVDGDPAATFGNIEASPSMLNMAVGAELVVLLSEVILSVLLYFLFKPVSPLLSGISAVSRLTMTGIHGINLLNYYFIFQLAGNPEYGTVFTIPQLQQLTSLFIDAHGYGFTLGVVFLSLHAVLLGYLIFRSGYFPKVLGILFLIASAGYLIDSLSLLFVPSYAVTSGFIAAPIVIAELAFPLWLLIRGLNMQKWQELQ